MDPKRFLSIILTFLSIQLFSQKIAHLQWEKEYLEQLKKSASDFRTEEEKLVFLADNIEKLDIYYNLASELSGIRNKPAALEAALKKKIVQCLIHQKDRGDRFSRGILTGLFENAPDLGKEYVPFLEEIIMDGSPWRKKKYLRSIALFEEENIGSLFSLEEKVRILACQYLLKIDPQHIGALDFFLNYGRGRKVSDYEHYFVVEENDWSGRGFMNEHGEWILPPLFDLPEVFYNDLFSEGFAPVRFTSNIYPNAKSENTTMRYQSFGNWVNSKGEFLLDSIVAWPRAFSSGVAKYHDLQYPKYVDTLGNPIKELDGQQKDFLKNGYSVSFSETGTVILGKNGEVLAELDKQYRNVRLIPQDSLITYGTINGSLGRGKYGYLSLDGQKLTDTIFYTSSDYGYTGLSFNGREVAVMEKDLAKYGLVNRQFETLIPFEHQYLRIINRKYVVAKNVNDYTLFLTTGEWVSDTVPEAFINYSARYDGDIGLASVNNRLLLVDIDGNEIAALKEYEPVALGHGKIILKNKEGKTGILDHKYNVLLPFIYDEAFLLPEDMALAKEGERYKSINLESGAEFEFPRGYKLRMYDYETGQNVNFIRFEKDGKIGMVRPDGKVAVPFECYFVKYGGKMN